MGNRSCLALSIALLFLASVASLPGAPKESTPAATTKLAVSDVEASKPDLPRVNVVAQAATKPEGKVIRSDGPDYGLDDPTFDQWRLDALAKELRNLTDSELAGMLKEHERDVVLLKAEIARRTPKQVAAPVKASTCDPNCQCAVTGICTCGPDCPCTCPKAASGVAVANPTVTYQTRQEAVYGPMGFFRGYRTVSVPVVTSSTMVVTSRPISVSSPSRVVTTSYPSSSVKVSTPVGSSSTTTRFSTPVRRCVVGADGVRRCYTQ